MVTCIKGILNHLIRYKYNLFSLINHNAICNIQKLTVKMWETGFSCSITLVFGRSDSEFEMSPKSISRHSSVASNISG